MKLAHPDQTKIREVGIAIGVTRGQSLQLHQVRCAIECGKHQSIGRDGVDCALLSRQDFEDPPPASGVASPTLRRHVGATPNHGGRIPGGFPDAEKTRSKCLGTVLPSAMPFPAISRPCVTVPVRFDLQR